MNCTNRPIVEIESLELIKHLIKISNFKGKILDPFGGSGTTSIASEILGYDSVYIERDPNYFEIAKERTRQINRSDIDF